MLFFQKKSVRLGGIHLNGYISRKGDFLWLLLRNQCRVDGTEQLILSWTGYHHEVEAYSNNLFHKVHYLPAIDQSPTKMDTVQEILAQVQAKAIYLELTCTDLVFDHAIYAKAVNNLNNFEMKDLFNLAMGGFHACCIYLAVICKRFGAAGLRDIIIESG